MPLNLIRRRFAQLIIASTTAAALGNLAGKSSAQTNSAQSNKQQAMPTGEREMASNSRLNGKVAVITGAARGIGRATALTLAREGADIVALDIAAPKAIDSLGYPLATTQDLAETERLVKALGRRCLTVKADTRDMARMREVIEQAIAQLGKVDIMVANAGILPRVSLEETTDEVWRDCIDVNLTGVGNSVRAVVPHMKQRKSGRIVAVASEFARHCLAPNRVVYTASKWGVMGLVKAAAMELSQTGITVNAVSPGFTRTGMAINEEVFRSVLPKDPNPTVAEVESEIRRMNIEKNALPISFVEPADIANAILYLVSDEARYITGFAIDVTGGFSPQYSA